MLRSRSKQAVNLSDITLIQELIPERISIMTGWKQKLNMNPALSGTSVDRDNPA
jgi:hypothetical protein